MPFWTSLLGLGLVARGQLEVALGAGDAGLDLVGPLALGVELGADEDRLVRDPQPDEEADDAAQRPVGLAV